MNHIQAGGMRQVRALAWEFWAHGWRGQLLGLAGVVGFASLLYGAISLESDLSFRGTEVGTSMHFGFFWVTLIFLGAPILAAWGAPQRRYTLPTSSFVIVACPMVCSMVSMFVLYAMAATTLNLLYDAGWPIWGPGLVAALSVAWLQAILWSTSNSQGLQLVSSLVSFGVLLFAVVLYASPGGPTTGWFQEGLDTSFMLMFGLASLVCVGVGTVGFANLRRGSGFDVNRIVEWADRLLPKTARATPFSSPTSAQFWLEWTERGYVMPVGTALIGVAMLLITPFVAHEDSDSFLGGMTMILFPPAIVIGIFLGGRSENGQFGNFNGSRPLTDSQVAKAVLTSTTVGVLSSALIWAAVMGTVSLILGQASNLPSLQSMIEQFEPIHLLEFATLGFRLLGITTLGIGAIWGAVGLMTSLFLAGKKVSGVVVCTVFGVLIAGSIGPKFLLSPEAQDTFRYVLVPACIVLPLVGIAACFVASWRLQLISRGTLVLAAAIVAAMFAGAHLSGFTMESEFYLPVLWACSLTPSALAVAPLAVWWNRHR